MPPIRPIYRAALVSLGLGLLPWGRALACPDCSVGRAARVFISSGVLLGTGLGGFVDGIVLHQILQWHNMLSEVRPPNDLVTMKYNMVWDGVFHAFAWMVTAGGLTRLWMAGLRSDVFWSTQTFVGSLFLGWGAFNIVEGLIDHQLLGIHHVHPGEAELWWDLAFLFSGVLMAVIGCLSIRAARPQPLHAGLHVDPA